MPDLYDDILSANLDAWFQEQQRPRIKPSDLMSDGESAAVAGRRINQGRADLARRARSEPLFSAPVRAAGLPPASPGRRTNDDLGQASQGFLDSLLDEGAISPNTFRDATLATDNTGSIYIGSAPAGPPALEAPRDLDRAAAEIPTPLDFYLAEAETAMERQRQPDASPAARGAADAPGQRRAMTAADIDTFIADHAAAQPQRQEPQRRQVELPSGTTATIQPSGPGAFGIDAQGKAPEPGEVLRGLAVTAAQNGQADLVDAIRRVLELSAPKSSGSSPSGRSAADLEELLTAREEALQQNETRMAALEAELAELRAKAAPKPEQPADEPDAIHDNDQPKPPAKPKRRAPMVAQ